MSDVVVTVPKTFGLDTWIGEGDPAGAPWSGQEWHFYCGGSTPKIEVGERVYVTYNGVLRGYSPLVRIDRPDGRHAGRFAFVRHGDAVAVTIPERVNGFRGWRYRWWKREVEMPFAAWTDPLVVPASEAVHALRATSAIDPLILVRRLSTELPKWTYRFTDERTLHNGLALALDQLKVAYRREVVDGSDRFDFMCDGGIVIEAKVDGSLVDALRQVERYCRKETVAGALIVASKRWAASSIAAPPLHGKPVQVIRLGGQSF